MNKTTIEVIEAKITAINSLPFKRLHPYNSTSRLAQYKTLKSRNYLNTGSGDEIFI